MMTNRFQLAEESTPTQSPVQILALETQARSPQVLALSRIVSAMQERLEKMRSELREVLRLDEEFPTGHPNLAGEGPLQRKLFVNSEYLCPYFFSTPIYNNFYIILY